MSLPACFQTWEVEGWDGFDWNIFCNDYLLVVPWILGSIRWKTLIIKPIVSGDINTIQTIFYFSGKSAKVNTLSVFVV